MAAARRARVVLPALVLLLVAPGASPATAHDVTLNGHVLFSQLDGSALDHDGAANGVFTVTDGDLVLVGTISCTDAEPLPQSADACRIEIDVGGDLVIQAGSGIQADNDRGRGNGGDIVLTVGGNLVLDPVGSVLPGGLISSSRLSGPDSDTERAGAIRLRVGGGLSLGRGSAVVASASTAKGGEIEIVAGGTVTIDGLVASGPSSRVSANKLTGRALLNGSDAQAGGPITIHSLCLVEPGILIGGDGVVVSQGELPGGARVEIDACGIEVRGLVASLSQAAGSSVALRSATRILVDGTDHGDPTATERRFGRVRADATVAGAVTNEVRLLAAGDLTIFGPPSTDVFVPAVSASPGPESAAAAGTVRAVAVDGTITSAGRAFQAGRRTPSNRGGTIALDARHDVMLDGARLLAFGDPESQVAPVGAGGTIRVQSYQGGVSWQSGLGDVRPAGAGAVARDRGSITLTYCSTLSTAGTQFPVVIAAIPPFPDTVQACEDGAPPLPPGETLPDLPLTVVRTDPVHGATVVPLDAVITIDFSEAVELSADAFVLACPATAPARAFSLDRPTSHSVVLTPSSHLPVDTVCEVRVEAMQVSYAFSFSTSIGTPATITSAAATTFEVGTARSFLVVATGFPTPRLSMAGALPAGVTLRDNGDGTATLSGAPAAGTSGFYGLTLTASSGDSQPMTQSFTLTVLQGPGIATAGTVTFAVGLPGTFAVAATGWPTPNLTKTGALPEGLRFVDHGNGTASLLGTPASGTAGTYPLTVTAANEVGSQNHALTMVVRPALKLTQPTSTPPPTDTTAAPTGVTLAAGMWGGGLIATTTGAVADAGRDTPRTSRLDLESGNEPSSASPGGSEGTPEVEPSRAPQAAVDSEARGKSRMPDSVTDRNAAGSRAREFPALPPWPPAFATGTKVRFTAGAYARLTVLTTGVPAPTITREGALPVGLDLTDHGNGTATLFGVLGPESIGTHALTLIATNARGAAQQEFVLTVCPEVVIAPDGLLAGRRGMPFTQTFSASGGTGPYEFAVRGAPPAGLHLEGSTLSGTPSSSGSFSVTVSATDATGCSDSRVYTLRIGPETASDTPVDATGHGGSRSTSPWHSLTAASTFRAVRPSLHEAQCLVDDVVERRVPDVDTIDLQQRHSVRRPRAHCLP